MSVKLLDKKEFEVMSPVGSYESLMAAIQGGADAVYFGIGVLNMRSRSSVNFTMEDLYNICDICRKHSVHSYLTVNTILYDNDLDVMRDLINRAAQAGISAVIASDVAAMSYARELGVEVHLSTQLNISNTDSLIFYSQFADVVVLARELSLEQVAHIASQIKKLNITGPSGKLVRIEMFCHGALCMAVSGKCYLSLHEKNVSANRGACNQICRRSYRVEDKESEVELEIDNEYIMSPKDLKTIHFLNKMMDAGVTVFKIEGRARGPEYVRMVTECYKEAVEAYCNGNFNEELIAKWDNKLSQVFNRGFWNGYYLGQRLGEWTDKYGSSATKRKVYVGKAIKYFSNLKVGEFLIEAYSLKVGDEILIAGPTTGALTFTIDELRVDLKNVDSCDRGEYVSFKVPEKIRPSDKLYKMEDVPVKKMVYK